MINYKIEKSKKHESGEYQILEYVDYQWRTCGVYDTLEDANEGLRFLHEKFIVKIQIPNFISESDPRVCIYNKDRSINELRQMNKSIKKAMGNEKIKYFYAHKINNGIKIYFDIPMNESVDW